VFRVSRRWWVIGYPIDCPNVEDKRSLRFSLLGLIAITTLVAIVVTLSRATRSSINSDSAGFMAASFGLFLLAFLANTYFAVHAILRPGRVASSLLLVMLLSSLLGVALSLAMGQDDSGVLMVLAGAVISVAPTLVVVGSLLVVRSCGIRLVRQSLRPTDGESGAIIASPFRL